MCLLLTNYSQYFSGNAKSEKNPRCQMKKGREHFHEIFLSPGDFSLATLIFPSQILTVFFCVYPLFHLCLTFYTMQLGVHLHELIDKIVQKDRQKKIDTEVKPSMLHLLSYLFQKHTQLSFSVFLSLCISLPLSLSVCLCVPLSLTHTHTDRYTPHKIYPTFHV